MLVAVARARAAHAAAVSDGLALGIVGVVLLALASRFWWGDIGPGAPPSFFPVQTRLHYPVNYWNGLAILAGLALPAAAARRGRRSGPPILRALALVPVPAIAAAIYLTSSRGGAAAAACGVLVFWRSPRAGSPRSWRPASRAVGACAAIEVLLARDDARERPAVGAGVAGQGRERRAADRVAGPAAARPSTGPGAGSPTGSRASSCRCAAKVALAGAVAACRDRASPPSTRSTKFDDFKRPPGETSCAEGDFTRSHLLSSTSTRPLAAVDARPSTSGRRSPSLGRGAGSYQSWWMEHADSPLFVRDAHSLWLEMLGELGRGRLRLLIVLAFGTGLRGCARAPAARRPGAAAGRRRWPACWPRSCVAAAHRLDVGADASSASWPSSRSGCWSGGNEPVRSTSRAAAVAVRRPAAGCATGRCARRRLPSRWRRSCASPCRCWARNGWRRARPRRHAGRRRRGRGRGRGRSLAAAVGGLALPAARADRGAGGRSRRRRTATSRMRSSATAPTGASGW